MEYVSLIISAMNPAVPARPRVGISVYMHICKHRTAPPCTSEIPECRSLIELQCLMIFIVRV